MPDATFELADRRIVSAPGCNLVVMKTERVKMMIAQTERPKGNMPESANVRRWGTVIMTVILLGLFFQACFAGAMISGAGWALRAHSLTSTALIVATIVASLVSLATFRRSPHGLKFGLGLLALAMLMLAQAAVGILSAKGSNLLWIHVPLGVALFGMAVWAVTNVRHFGPSDNVSGIRPSGAA